MKKRTLSAVIFAFEVRFEQYILHFFIVSCGIIDELPMFGKS